MSESREPYMTSTAPIAATNGDNRMPLIVSGDDWRYNMLLALEQHLTSVHTTVPRSRQPKKK